MVPVEGSEEVIPADLVLIAAGFLGSQKYVTDAFHVAVNGRTNVETKPEAYETSAPRVFTAGICIEASPWSYGPSGREEKLQKQWMNLLWVIQISEKGS